MVLTKALIDGDITPDEYDREWTEVLAALGWDERRYEFEVDRRWDYLFQEPDFDDVVN